MYIDTPVGGRHRRLLCCQSLGFAPPAASQRAEEAEIAATAKTATTPRVPILVPRRILSAAYFNLACVAFFPCCTEDILSPLSAKCL